MSNPSNLYAEKIYSEHPLVLWALDDQADYVSLITEEKRNIVSLWDDTESCTLSSGSAPAGEPFSDSFTSIVSCNVPAGAFGESIILSPDIDNFQNLNTTLGTFSIGSYFYIDSLYIDSISIFHVMSVCQFVFFLPENYYWRDFDLAVSTSRIFPSPRWPCS